MVALCPSDRITAEDLPYELQHIKFEMSHMQDGTPDNNTHIRALKDSVEQLEMQMIRQALERNKSALQAAEELGIDASTLSKKRKRYGLF